MLNYLKNYSLAILVTTILSIATRTIFPAASSKKRAVVTLYTMMTILLLSAVILNNQNPSIPLIYAEEGNHKDSKVIENNNNNQQAQSGDGAKDKGDNVVDNSNSGETPSSPQPIIPTETQTSVQLERSTNNSIPNLASVPEGKNCATNLSERPNPIQYLTYFNCGHVTTFKNGTTLREFSLITSENNIIPISDIGTNDPVLFNAWTFNGTIPGPTMRMTEGDHVKITVYNDPNSKNAHALHMHSIHSGPVDGVTGPAGAIPPGGSYTYSFVASPRGVYPYHCHVEPVTTHINRGLYGMMIIDPKTPRTSAKEMVMMMNGYNLLNDYAPSESTQFRPPTAAELRANFSEATKPDEGADNQIYTVNGQAFIYRDKPIDLVKGQPYRIYLTNMLEFDPVNSFHLHGNMFEYYPSGTGTNPSFLTDIVTLGQGDRGIMEFTYNITGMYMFHAHKNEFTNLGWMGMFNVTDKPITTPTNAMALMGQQPTTIATTQGKDNNNTPSAIPFLQ
jgi:hypothetical protein